MKAAKFVCEGIEGEFSGFTRGDKWNGWECPLLPHAEMKRFLTALCEAEGVELTDEGESFLIAEREESYLTHYAAPDGTPLYEAAGFLWYPAEEEDR